MCPALALLSYIYPNLPGALLDVSGLLVVLSAPQYSSVFIPGLGNLYTVYALNDDSNITSQLTDDTSANYSGPGVDVAGYNGAMVLSNCITSAVGRAIGDPQLSGFLGQSFQVHGVSGQLYNLISTQQLQVNARFVFLGRGDCPIREGQRRATHCWSHPGSYFSDLSVETADGSRLAVVAGPADAGFLSVLMNSSPVKLGESLRLSSFTVHRLSSYSLQLSTPPFTLDVENSDGFLNLLSVRVSSLAALRASDAHGLLGQTWRRPSVPGAEVREIEGRVDDYAVSEAGEFAFNRFHGKGRAP